MYRTNITRVPKVEGLKRDDGWIDMQVQFLIDKKSAGADHVVGWTVLKPGASHERHPTAIATNFFSCSRARATSSPARGSRRQARATWCIHRAASGTDSTIRQMTTWCWSGAGWGGLD
jgi:hypothetical protein